MTAHEISPVRPPDDVRHDVEVHRDVRIPTGDPGITLSADVFRPVTVSEVPALVTLLPYRKDAGAGIANERALRWFAGHGYASVLVDFRGTGSSDGRHRPPFDPAEADDGVAAVEWVVHQPWCDGNVGIWGHSYGAVMALRTASRRPAGLRAIIPVMGMTDPGPDFVHPAGRRGCLASLAQWATDTLLNQLLPPLHDFGSPDQQRRWQDRLETEPWLLDLFRHGPDDPVWQARAIDVDRITVPTFCVAGWRDLFCDSSISTFERIGAPKKLLAGPWMHTMPDDSPFLPIGFSTLALRWWRHWLEGIDTGLLDEPAVTVYRQGGPGGWEQFDSWPPVGHERRFATTGGALAESDRPVSTSAVIAQRTPDPTVGALSGLSGMPTTGFGLPLDQHDDDARCLVVTSAPLASDLCVAGRPSLTVWADGVGRSLVIRLTDVDQHDRSVLVSTGVTTEQPDGHRADLTPTRYTVPAGHRVRVVIDGGDFPRLWPVSDGGPVLLRGIEVRIPVLSTEPVTTTLPPPAGEPVDQPGTQEPLWRITRDLVHDGVTVTIGELLTVRSPGEGHLLRMRREIAATVRHDPTVETTVLGSTTAQVELTTGTEVDVEIALDLTDQEIAVDGRITVDGEPTFARRWTAAS
ncbi:MAG TPA: CocE/NonD family hydrolase [Pseudonocardiaceae bacterium]|nr:CocE/NonD family hydrolase [Pseudonocardiaceae bacterium]